ncbi:hypothetical protein Micbo1qcDRAFT_126044 [Microdochium bolleyi]|uniref:Integral membrane protein n=1 Tax=Microdochium bolleyi TaxID=196109 RepID=A0A136INK0_9PEZI|nr:hypothetical protein Micbo1qcDRAFT_126044 [Microdochium bolleyi]
MGSSDIPPPHAPAWLIPAQVVLLGVGVLCWDITYILMHIRSRATKSSGMPLGGLAVNISWEIVYAFVAADTPLEQLGFATWLALDMLVVHGLVRHAETDWAGTSGFVGRHAGWLLMGMTAVGCVGHWAFVMSFFAAPVLDGSKAGKFWRGREGFDTTELSFWSAGFAQGVCSAASLAQIVVRGHSGGTGYLIWAVRFAGSIFGLQLAPGMLWWYWPEAHQFWVSPMALFMSGFAILCDIAYPVVLWQVRKTEVQLPDGRLVAGDSPEARKAKNA